MIVERDSVTRLSLLNLFSLNYGFDFAEMFESKVKSRSFMNKKFSLNAVSDSTK